MSLIFRKISLSHLYLINVGFDLSSFTTLPFLYCCYVLLFVPVFDIYVARVTEERCSMAGGLRMRHTPQNGSSDWSWEREWKACSRDITVTLAAKLPRSDRLLTTQTHFMIFFHRKEFQMGVDLLSAVPALVFLFCDYDLYVSVSKQSYTCFSYGRHCLGSRIRWDGPV